MAAWVEEIRRAAARFGEEKHMTKTKQHEPQQTVAACEQTLKELEAKRAKLVERGAELPELRKGAAYLAHVERNALRTVAETGKLLGNLLPQLHAAGVRSPTHEQLDALGYQAFAAAIMQTPWHRRFAHLAPNQRRSFRGLIDAWVMAIGPRLKAQLGEQEDEAAA
jgi:hypothetical protein